MLEQVLSDLISKTLLDLEIKNLNLIFTEKALVKLIKKIKILWMKTKTFLGLNMKSF